MASKRIQAGPFSIQYHNGFIRRIMFGNREILRMIYFALRDEHWGTYFLNIEDEKIEIKESGFNISYHAHNKKDNIKIFEWQVAITGDATGRIKFTLRGQALAEVLKNRAGFCVLHPLRGLSGQTCDIRHPDSTNEPGKFPDFIAAENPFKDLTAMRWRSGELSLQLTLEGDIFETEDQRNWSDASYKTFCTPLSKPFPSLMPKDTQISQSVLFEITSGPTTNPQNDNTIQLKETETIVPLPNVGVGASTEVTDLSPAIQKQFSKIALSHYRVETNCLESSWSDSIVKEGAKGKMLQLTVELVFITTENFKEEIKQLLHVLEKNEFEVNQILFLSNAHVTEQPLIDYVDGLKEQFSGALLGAGTNYNFTEINRNHRKFRSLHFVSMSIDPQEHAIDDITLFENTEAQFDIIKSTRNIYPKQKIYISPVTLKRRFNPYSKDPKALVIPEPERCDERQSEQFCALFTLASIKNLTAAGCESITYYQTVGKQGIISAQGEEYPVYAMLRQVVKRNAEVQLLESSRPLEVDGMILFYDEDKMLVLWNFTNETMNARFLKSVYSICPQQIMYIPIS